MATKYINLTRAFFASHGIVDYRIVESAGDRRGAGGRHRRDDRRYHHHRRRWPLNGLKVLGDGVILRSQANLRGLARRRLVGGGARDRASSSITSPPAPGPASTGKSGTTSRNATPRCWRKPITVRRGLAVRRPDLVGHGDAAPPAGAALRARQLSSRPRRRHGIGGVARSCARPRQPAVCPARGLPAAVRRRLFRSSQRQLPTSSICCSVSVLELDR